MAKYHQGKFKPKNLNKYVGDHTNIVYRSSWEAKFMRWCDTNVSVINWVSEETVIPYFSVTDGRNHRYFVDFKIWLKQGDGSVKVYLVEIKPEAQIQRPKNPKVLTESAKNKIETWIKNQEKWKAAKSFAEARGHHFIVLNEYDLGIKKRNVR